MSKNALITWAARGIGLASSKKFSAHGYEVLMLDRDETELENAVQEVAGATTLCFNISSKEAATEIAASLIRSHGALNALINNADVAKFDTIENCSVESWRRVMETNLDGMFYLSQALIPTLRTSKGSIVNIASISGLRASTLSVAYGTSKAAVMQLSK